MTKTGYYPDGVTKITDPFYQCVCRKCLYFFWGIQITSRCPQCGSDDVFRSFDQQEAKSELLRIRNSK